MSMRQLCTVAAYGYATPPPLRESIFTLKSGLTRKFEREDRRRREVRFSDSAPLVPEGGRVRSWTLSGTKARLSLLVLIFMLTTLLGPAIAGSTLLEEQRLSAPANLRQIPLDFNHSIKRTITYKHTITVKIYKRIEYPWCKIECFSLHSCSEICFSNSLILIPEYFISSAWETVCLKFRFKLSLLRFTRVPSSSQHSLCNWTWTKWSSLPFDWFAVIARTGCNNAAVLYPLQAGSIDNLPAPFSGTSTVSRSAHKIVILSLLGT